MTQSASTTPPTAEISVVTLLPWLVITAVVSVVVSLLAYKYMGPRYLAPSTVVFDIVKYNNAQQRLVGQLLQQQKGPEVSEAALLIKGLSGRAKQAIEEVAGPSTVVLIRQGVVSSNVVDITDAVLNKLGLPTDVPSLSAADPQDDLSFFLRRLKGQVPAATEPVEPARSNALP